MAARKPVEDPVATCERCRHPLTVPRVPTLDDLARRVASSAFRPSLPEGAVLTVRRSKTGREGKEHAKALHFGKRKATCPVAALKAWIKAAGLAEGPLFRTVDRWGHPGSRRLTGKTVSDVVRDRARLLGLDPDAIGAHSLRSGLVTDGYAAGVAEADIMRQTGHKSRAVLEGYYREANLLRGNVTEKVGL